jgi:hypothetical protein
LVSTRLQQGAEQFRLVELHQQGIDRQTLTINEVNVGRNSPHRFRLVLVTVEGEQASPPVYVSGVDWGLPGFGDTQITKNLQQLLAAWRAPH